MMLVFACGFVEWHSYLNLSSCCEMLVLRGFLLPRELLLLRRQWFLQAGNVAPEMSGSPEWQTRGIIRSLTTANHTNCGVTSRNWLITRPSHMQTNAILICVWTWVNDDCKFVIFVKVALHPFSFHHDSKLLDNLSFGAILLANLRNKSALSTQRWRRRIICNLRWRLLQSASWTIRHSHHQCDHDNTRFPFKCRIVWLSPSLSHSLCLSFILSLLTVSFVLFSLSLSLLTLTLFLASFTLSLSFSLFLSLSLSPPLSLSVLQVAVSYNSPTYSDTDVLDKRARFWNIVFTEWSTVCSTTLRIFSRPATNVLAIIFSTTALIWVRLCADLTPSSNRNLCKSHPSRNPRFMSEFVAYAPPNSDCLIEILKIKMQRNRT